MGLPSYGYKVEVQTDDSTKIRRFVHDPKEQKVIEFIEKCRADNTNLTELNDLMQQLTCIDPFLPIILNDGSDTLIKPLEYKNIAQILRSYKIPYRNGRRWTAGSVSRIRRRCRNVI